MAPVPSSMAEGEDAKLGTDVPTVSAFHALITAYINANDLRCAVACLDLRWRMSRLHCDLAWLIRCQDDVRSIVINIWLLRPCLSDSLAKTLTQKDLLGCSSG